MKRTEIKDLLQSGQAEQDYLVKGWVRTNRKSKAVSFVHLNDGSTIKNIQIVADVDLFGEDLIKDITTGSSIAVEGTLKESGGSGQSVEILAKKIEIIGHSDVSAYPLQPKKHSLEFLREIAHLRPRTNTFSAVFRVRHAAAYAIHKYFNDRGYYYIHAPVITGSDAEGAGEMFKVTTFDLKNVPLNEDGSINYKEDFFEKETNLTVSGQLEAELAALGLGKVYTFAPTFRAENSNTTRHLAEFWMIEPEVAFADINDNMDIAEDFLKYVIGYVKDHCQDDLAFLAKRFDDEENTKPKEKRSAWSHMDKLQMVLDNDFERITYTEAFDILRNSKPNKKKKFDYLITEWGADLQSEHEKFLVEKHFKKPVIVTDYPASIKAFYMRMNEDGKTVRGMDILFPGIGEMVGGSQREERLDKLMEGIKRFNIEEESLWWYLETRKYGTTPHSGFGLGFERLVLFLTGMTNIRDVIPFPRTPGNAEF